MSDTARRHHYVPAFYLAGFTNAGRRDDFLTVIELTKARKWRARPDNVGFETDYFRVDAEGLEPDAVERALADIESTVAPALRAIAGARRINRPEDLSQVLNLVAILAARVPGVREIVETMAVEVGRHFTDQLFESPHRYEAFLRERKAAGEDVSKYPSFERLHRGWREGAFYITANSTWTVMQLLQMGALIYEMLVRRDWSLVVTEAKVTGGFITSDRPVALYWTRQVPAFYSPGFMMPDTEVLFPLDRCTALLGQFEASPAIIHLDARGTAFVNTRILNSASRYVYCSEDGFAFRKEDGTTGDIAEFMGMIRERRNGDANLDPPAEGS